MGRGKAMRLVIVRGKAKAMKHSAQICGEEFIGAYFTEVAVAASGKKHKKSRQKKAKEEVDENNSVTYPADHALVSSILAGQQLEAGKMVMNSGSQVLEHTTSSSEQYRNVSGSRGTQLSRAAGTHAKNETHCLVRLPSNAEEVLDSGCRATIGIVLNPNHGARKLVKAGQARWLGRRP
ncbi:hypothetical protein KI387_042864, partial [Taxus chinensis]